MNISNKLKTLYLKYQSSLLFKLAQLAAATLFIAAISLAVLFTTDSAGPGVCLFNRFTGLYCYGCGMTRAIRSLLHGRFLTAMDYNLFSVIALPLLIYAFVCYFVRLFTGKKIVFEFFYHAKFYIWFFALFTLFVILRNIPVYPFTILAP